MKISAIEILTGDLAATEAFYDAVLGLEIFERKTDRISFGVGASILTFIKGTGNPVYHFAFTIPCNQIHEAERWIAAKAAVIKLNNEPIIDFPNWNAKSVYFYDNNGNILELIARFDLENGSDLPFGPFSLLSISEVALATDDVSGLAKHLISEHGLSFFSKQKQKDDFSVIGDDDGLLILSSLHRHWFPTEVVVEKFGVKVLVENKGELINIEHGL